MKKTLQEIAGLIDGRLIGAGEIEITGVNNLEEAKKITEESEKELADEKVEQVTGGRIYDFPK